MSAVARVRVGEVAEQIRGVSYGKGDAEQRPKEGYLPVLRAGNITDEGLVFSDLVYVPSARISHRQLIRMGDVVVAASSGSLDVVGKAAPAKSTFNGGFGAFCKVLRPSAKVDAAFFAHFFKTSNYRRKISSLAAGANINNLKNEHLDDLEISLPSLPEQRRIAAILDVAESLRTQRRAAIEQLDKLTQAIFIDMFGGAQSKGWPVVTIADLAAAQPGSIRTGPFGSQLLHSEFVDEGVAVLGIDNAVANEFRWGERRFITPAKHRELQRYTVHPGDVLITIMGTCGRCAVVPDDIPLAINTKHLCCITVDAQKCVPQFLHAYFLRHPSAQKYLQQTAKGAIMSGLNMGIIKALPMALPPLTLQQAFATRVQAIEALKAKHRAILVLDDALFASLQHRAFAGAL